MRYFVRGSTALIVRTIIAAIDSFLSIRTAIFSATSRDSLQSAGPIIVAGYLARMCETGFGAEMPFPIDCLRRVYDCDYDDLSAGDPHSACLCGIVSGRIS
jgi:hypothetical protein